MDELDFYFGGAGRNVCVALGRKGKKGVVQFFERGDHNQLCTAVQL